MRIIHRVPVDFRVVPIYPKSLAAIPEADPIPLGFGALRKSVEKVVRAKKQKPAERP